jgi:hypothetical protein
MGASHGISVEAVDSQSLQVSKGCPRLRDDDWEEKEHFQLS